MAGSRTLKLSILAETKDLVEGLGKATKSTETFGDKATEFGKKAALAFAVAGAAALAFAGDAVKAAAEDEAAQLKLAETIKATTNATAAQVKGVEDYITKTSIAVGVADDQLRPAFGRLVRSTKDVDEAQRLLNLALDLSVATSRPVEQIANALGRAYDGNTTALGKLGLGLDANLIKSKDTDAIITQLEGTFGRFAEGAAETAAVKFERIRIATDEAKESIGAALLPVVQQLSDYILTTFVPNLNTFIAAFTGKGSVTDATADGTEGAYKFGQQVRRVFNTIVSLKDELIVLAKVIAGVFVVSKIAAAVTATIGLIKSLIIAYNALKASAIVAGVASAFALNPLLGVGAVALAAGVLAGANALANGSNVSTSGLGISTGSIPFASGFGVKSVTSSSNADLDALVAADLAKAQASAKAKDIKDATRSATTAAGIAATATGRAARVAETVTEQIAAGGAFTDSQNIARLLAAGGAFTDSQNAARINITVNGAIDKEGTARTIVQTLNDSFYRGTNGASSLQFA